MKFLENRKIFLSLFFFVTLAVFILSKAVYLQVIARKKLILYSQSQLIRETIVYPKRGNVYDRNGEPLAINIQRYGIFTIPKNFKKQKNNYLKLTKIVPELSFEKIKSTLSKRSRYTWLARKIELSEKQLEELAKLDDIYVSSEPSRYYPNGELLAQTLGFVGIDNVGLSGIEFKMDKTLRGEGKIVKYLKDAKGRSIKFESTKSQDKAEDIYLTIDKEMQAIVEKYLKEAVLLHDADRGGAGILNSETGEILAMANYPTFDPNNFFDYSSEQRKLAFISDPYESGSVFKVFTVASALQNKLAGGDTFYYCEKGQMEIGGHLITEAETYERFEWLSVADILKHSSNIGVTKIAFDLSFPVLKKTLTNFNLLDRTGIELPGESKGIFTTKDNVDPLTLSNISFGQGVATTAIQLLSAYGALSNGGYYIPPTIIKKNRVAEKNKIMNEDVVKTMQNMMSRVVSEGTGKNARIHNFQVAGKTGTAQKASKNGGYDGHIASFIGFPIGIDKKYVVLVYIDNPKKHGYYGGSIAAPVFKKIMAHLLYKNEESEILGPNLEKVVIQNNLSKIKVKNKVKLSESKKIIPNLIGLDKLSVERMIKDMPLKVTSKGSGLVSHQSVSAGTEIAGDAPLELELSYEREQISEL